METLKDIFVSYEIAQKLKEIGFNEKCIAYKYARFEDIIANTNIKLINRNISVYIDPINYEDKKNDRENIENYLLIPSYEQVFQWFISKGFYFSYNYNYDEDNFYNVIHIEKNFYDNSDEDSDGHYYYDKSGSVCGSYEVLKEIIINTAIKMYKVYLSDKKTYLCKKDEEL